MNEPTYRLEGFEGPLDVLLTLIERHKIDIYNIEISLLLEQYMKWMDDARERNLDITADFLEMASRLVYIKSCSLLPKTEDEEEDPKWLLEQMLIEYAKYKRVALQLRPQYQGDRIWFKDHAPTDLPKPDYEGGKESSLLLDTYLKLMKRHKDRIHPPKESFDRIVKTQFIAVGTKIVSVMRVLVKKSRSSFKSLFKGAKSRSEVVATFLALLELMRSGRVEVLDTEDQHDPEIRLIRNKKQGEEIQ
ncbi:MAG: segregation/condensation protein A [Clostridia bacterium]|nr:segregation/condensation protein A [Clostridia bacterium]